MEEIFKEISLKMLAFLEIGIECRAVPAIDLLPPCLADECDTVLDTLRDTCVVRNTLSGTFGDIRVFLLS